MTVHGRSGRRRARPPRRFRWLVVALVAIVAGAALTGAGVRLLARDATGGYASSHGWPAQGQGAYQLGADDPVASPAQRPAPIASLAKVMTAYVVLAKLPLTGRSNGPVLTVSAADAADAQERAEQGQSVVLVQAGDRLSERDALMAVLLPSSNNIAVLLARYVSGSVDAFVDAMNQAARTLGMHDTTYTDPSGFDAGTVSTAVDQLTLAHVAAADSTLAAMMATPRYDLPDSGTIYNTDALLGSDGFVGMKTGSMDSAGGCFMFHARRVVDGRTVDLIGVVLGQQGYDLLSAGLYAARQLADAIAPQPA
jgi:D-alanyl-D-alanine carboxypeptidase (penicillin-binding protein 5/6)